MIKVWMSLGSSLQSLIVVILLVMLCMMIFALVYRLIVHGAKFKASLGSASVEIDATEENEEEEISEEPGEVLNE